MFPYVAAAIAGMWLGSRRNPHAVSQKSTMYGPKTGLTWKADVYKQSGVTIVSGHGGSVTFKKTKKGLTPVAAGGNAKAVKAILIDFGADNKKDS